MRSTVRLCVALPFLVAACAPKGETAVKDSAATATPPVVDAAAVRQSIEQANAKAGDALKRGDTASFGADYADDAIMIMAGAPPVRGKAEIKKAMVEMSNAIKLTDAKFTTSQLDIAGDYAIETGTYELTGTPTGAKAASTTKGNYVTVWKKQADGSYKIYRDAGGDERPPKK